MAKIVAYLLARIVANLLDRIVADVLTRIVVSQVATVGIITTKRGIIRLVPGLGSR